MKLRRAWLRASAMALAASLLAWPLTVSIGVFAAVLGALAGTLAGEAAAPSRLRTGSGMLLAVLGAALGLLVAHALVVASTPARLLGPLGALQLAEALRWLALSSGLVFLLRLGGRRSPLFAVVEVVAVALAVTSSVAAHRDGMVNRPYAIGDWAWSRGIDPGSVLLVLGGVVALALALLLFDRRRQGLCAARGGAAAGRGRWRHVLALVALALVLVLVVRTTGGPAPKTAGDLGLTGDPALDQAGGGNHGDGGRSNEGDDDAQLDDLKFKNEYSSSGNKAPVAVVVLHDDYAPPSGVYYFRQSAFSQYNGRRLVRATRDDVDQDLVDRFPSRPQRIAHAPPVGPERMTLPTSIGLLVDHVHPFALDAPAMIRPMQNPNPSRFRRAFEVESRVQTVPYEAMIGRQPGRADWSEEQWRYYTEAPADPRYRALAESLLARLKPEYRDDPLAEALTVKDYLETTGIYSRKSTHAGTGDPTASFLFGDKTGYCVHFAHAATFLFRSLGLPARVAAGYAVPESSRGGGSTLMLRGQNAHAWPEIYLGDVGWVVVDPAPQQSLDEPTTPPDQALQRMLGEMMRQSEPGESLREALGGRWDLALIARGLALLALLLVLGAYSVKIYRQVLPQVAPQEALYRVGYRAALDQLAEVGCSRRFGETREDFARRVAARSPTFVRLSDRHLARAFGSRRPANAAELRVLAGRVRGDLGRAVPVWRRALGALDPFSWLRAR